MFHSDAKQDQFVANLLKFKRDGTYVDIGSCGSVGSNNSFYFDNELGWRGLCVEIDPNYQGQYSQTRKRCTAIFEDALSLDYSQIFKDMGMPKIIDYLSIDIDELSVKVLDKIPFGRYSFQVITIEHDAYLGNSTRPEQRKILRDLGYVLAHANVLVEQPGYEGRILPFEDWWVMPGLSREMESINKFPSEIIAAFK